MAELQANALTTLQRIKDRLTITSAGFDTVLERMINGVSDHIEGYCNRKFYRATYTNEVYTVYNQNQPMIALNNAPVVSISSAQYRAGTPSTPAWTSFITDQYELSGDGKAGLVRIYGGVPRGVNSVRFTYIAGYLVDFAHPTDLTKHTLPADLTDLAERLVTKRFKRRDHEASTTETFEGSTLTWDEFLTADDKAILNRYRKLPAFV